MAWKAPRPCKTTGCPGVTIHKSGYCTKCQPGADAARRRANRERDRQRPSPKERGFDANWQRARQMKLATTPLCEMCMEHGLTVPATLVHHINENHLDNDVSNLYSMCRPCHERLHAPGRFGMKPKSREGFEDAP